MNCHKPKFPEMNIYVTVYDLQTGEEIRRHKMDYNDANCRKWLQRLSIWAWNNHYAVETINVEDRHLADDNQAMNESFS